MAARPVPFKELQRTVAAFHKALDEGYPAEPQSGNTIPCALRVAAEMAGLSPNAGIAAFEHRLNIAMALGIVVRGRYLPVESFIDEQRRRYAAYDPDYVAFTHILEPDPRAGLGGTEPATAPAARRSRGGRGASPQPAFAPGKSGLPDQKFTPGRDAPDPALRSDPAGMTAEIAATQIPPLLRRGPLTLIEVAERLNIEVPLAFYAIKLATDRGAPIYDRSGKYHLDPVPAMGSQRGDQPTLLSDENGVIRFAAIGDTHLGSKYARLDCLNDFYDQLEHFDTRIVLHAGNWIDGEAPFNRHDLLVHGMDQQMQYLAKHYPWRDGVETWAITGEDHEGWYSRREGVDVGRYAERVMRDNGREDWRDLGFMECFVTMRHADTGATSKLCLMHPGGGSAYAVSYAPQKIVEGFDGGDKPAVLLIGHYHKASTNLIRNVHVVQVGCFEDQTVFMRKNKLAAHVGGYFCELKLDPETGAVKQFTSTLRNYFVRDYYSNRWSQHGDVTPAPRSA